MRLAALTFALFATFSLVGCEEKKVVDIETPGVDVEVEEDGDVKIDN